MLKMNSLNFALKLVAYIVYVICTILVHQYRALGDYMKEQPRQNKTHQNAVKKPAYCNNRRHCVQRDYTVQLIPVYEKKLQDRQENIAWKGPNAAWKYRFNVNMKWRHEEK